MCFCVSVCIFEYVGVSVIVCVCSMFLNAIQCVPICYNVLMCGSVCERVCMYVCMSACIYVPVYVYVYAYACVCM